ncbi:MAG: amylo-alpha-1,6-glucosidase [Ignavibacteria bacterium]
MNGVTIKNYYKMDYLISEIRTVFFSMPLLIALFIIFNTGAMQSKAGNYKTEKLSAEDLQLSIENPDGNNRTISAGTRCYIVGTQDGNFPPLGWHIVDEMGGVWVPPLKTANGIWLRINDHYVTSAKKYIRKAAWSEYEFQSDEFHINRKDVALDNHSGALFIYTIKNKSSETKNLSLEIVTRFHPILSFPFVQNEKEYAKNKNAFDFNTRVYFDSTMSRVMVSTDKFNRFVALETNIWPENISFLRQNDLPIRVSKSFSQSGAADAVMKFNLAIKEGGEEKLIVGIAGSILSLLDASSTAEEIVKNADNLLEQKEKKYVGIANRSILSTPDEKINKAFLWNKLNTAMQVLNTPGLGTGTVAGYPDYPSYFSGDGVFTTPALLAIGQIEEVKNYLLLIARTSNGINNSSGKILHELITDGTVYWGRNADNGNTNETCQFVKAVGQVWKWTGDKEFIDELYPTVKKAMIDWLIGTQITEGDIFPAGNGLDEVDGWGPKRLDVQCYAVEGFFALAEMAEYLKDFETSKKAKYWAEEIKDGINKTWWMEEKGYYANSLTEDNKPILLGDISAVPLESKIVETQRAKILFDAISKSELNNEFGWGSMSISSGILAAAQANYGRMDEAVRYIKGIANYSGTEMPGDLPEHHPPFPVNPRHKQWQTNTIQLWGGYGLHFPLVNNMIGIQPDIPAKEIRVIPNLPAIWNNIECSNMIIGLDTLDVSITRTNGKLIVRINFHGNNKLIVGTVLPSSSNIKRFSINNSDCKKDALSFKNVLSGKEVTIRTELKNFIYKVEYE